MKLFRTVSDTNGNFGKKTQFSNPLGVVFRIFVNPVCAQRTRIYDPIRC